jgi:hypothetical protein
LAPNDAVHTMGYEGFADPRPGPRNYENPMALVSVDEVGYEGFVDPGFKGDT